MSKVERINILRDLGLKQKKNIRKKQDVITLIRCRYFDETYFEIE